MALSLITAPAVEPITLEDAKEHLRVEHGDEDALIESLIQVARETAETFTRRALITQTWDLVLESPLPSCDRWQSIRLLAPLIAVISITYVDTAGADQTLFDTAAVIPTTPEPDYIVDAPAGPQCLPGRIMPAPGITWPSLSSQSNAMTVRFTAGYGDPEDVPEAFKSAIKLIIGHLYANRESVVITDRGSIVQEVPQSAIWLLEPYVLVGF